MADVPETPVTGNDEMEPRDRSRWNRIAKHLNFYRIHLIFFTFTPLIFSVIFYLSNGEIKISYVDSLFVCISAMAVCGLASVDLSSLTKWQQTILFIQMSVGNPIIVSWFLVLSRRNYIDRNCSQIITEYRKQEFQNGASEVKTEDKGLWQRFLNAMGIETPKHSAAESDKENMEEGRSSTGIRPNMIRRTEDGLQRVNPSGFITDEGRTIPPSSANATPTDPLSRVPTSESEKKPNNDQPEEDTAGFSMGSTGTGALPRTVTFQTNAFRQRVSARPTDPDFEEHPNFPRTQTHISIPRTTTHQSIRSYQTLHSRKHQGFGGFPMPFTLIRALFRRMFPSLDRKLRRTLSIPATTSLVRTNTGQYGVKQASYVRENTIIKVSRNSEFHHLDPEAAVRFAYREYDSLRLLLWIIAMYHIGIQLIGFTVIAPYASTPRWSEVFKPPLLVKPVNSVWFSAFQAVSAYTNTGMSLVDQSLLPFQKAYPMIFMMIILILAGNTCYPIFLRFTIWCLLKFTSYENPTYETLEFLLHHPRRCYIYLFPSHQTWFLLTIVIGMTLIDWACFLILDIGNEVLSEIPLNVRVLDGFMQAIAVRAAGFAIVPLAALAPAVKVLYTIMMYISVYPIAMSVRSTNVLERNSLGIFQDPTDEEQNEDNFNMQGGRVDVWGRYLAMHVRQQLAFDMWWIALGVFIICIIEGKNLADPEKFGWFSVFNILFEVVSAYGMVGLSLGLPDRNYSFSGEFKPLAKLVICLVMIRGRHRGLPVAIDRAILFPKEYRPTKTPQGDNLPESGSLRRRSHFESQLSPMSTIQVHVQGDPETIHWKSPRSPKSAQHLNRLDNVSELTNSSEEGHSYAIKEVTKVTEKSSYPDGTTAND